MMTMMMAPFLQQTNTVQVSIIALAYICHFPRAQHEGCKVIGVGVHIHNVCG